ncbi:MAG: YfhO family protein, partial [Caldilinea sp.]
WMMLYTLGMAMLGGTGLAALPMRRLPLLAGLIGLAAVELWFAARSLPYSHPTAPQAVFEVRSAPAHLLTSPDREFPGAAARFLGMSKITYDPGDLADYRQQLVEKSPDPLDTRAFQELVIAQKVQELLVPNLPLFWQIPAVDGFDGGLLPLQRYLRLAELLVPPDRLVPDGRLREQIDQVPPSSLLAMLNVAYVVTDKVGDLWFEDVFYDRRIGAALAPLDAPLEVEVPSVFEATHIDLIGAVTGDSAAWAEGAQTVAQTVAWLEVTDRSGAVERLPLTAGGGPGAHFADAALDSPLATRSGVTVAYRDLEGGRQEYRARLPLASAREVASLRIRAVDAPVTLTVQAVTLYDARTRMFAALLPSDRGRFQLEHSGDVKIYRNLDLLPRAFLARQPVAVADLETAIEAVRSSAGTLTPVEGTLDGAQPAGPTDQAELLAYQPERVQIRTQSAAPALLVLSDSFYPGWSATVDGFPAQIKATNVQFRGVVVPAGEHTVTFTFLPTGWQLGVVLAALGGGLLLALASLGCMLARKVRYNHSHGRVTTQAR